MYIYGNDYTAIRVIDYKRKATVKALYIDIQIEHLLLYQKDYYYYTLRDIIPHNVDVIQSCYVYCSADEHMLTGKEWQRAIVCILHLLSSLPALKEVTLECSGALVNTFMVELLLSCYRKEFVFPDTLCDYKEVHTRLLSHFRTLVVRMSVSWHAYDALIPLLIAHREKLNEKKRKRKAKTVNFDIQMDLTSKGLTKEMLKFFEKCAYHDLIPSHVSVQWKGNAKNHAENRKAVSLVFSEYNVYPYQPWHFCQPHKQSMYLRSLYALSSHFGILIGYVTRTAEFWVNGDTTHNTITGTMKVNAEFLKKRHALLVNAQHVDSHTSAYSTDWDTIDAREEFDIRMSQGEDSEIVVVPFYLQEKLAGILNYNTILSSYGFKRFNRKDAQSRSKLEAANLLTCIRAHAKIGTVWFNDARIKRRFNIAYLDFS